MTLHATKHGERNVKIGFTYGPVEASEVVDLASARAFWSHLGRTLDDIEHPKQEVHEHLHQEHPLDSAGSVE